mgnify:CR=1 FL=1
MQSNRDRIKEMIEHISTFNDADPGEGISRFSYSENDAKARKYLIDICEDIGLKVRVDGNENLADIFCRRLLVGNQSGIGKSLVRIERVSVLIGREQGIELVLIINHQGMVVKSILMIIHIVSVKQEGSLPGLLDEFIPSLMVFGGVSCNSYHSRSRFMISLDYHLLTEM